MFDSVSCYLRMVFTVELGRYGGNEEIAFFFGGGKRTQNDDINKKMDLCY